MISQAIVGFRLGYIKEERLFQEILDLAYDIVRELTALIKSLENKYKSFGLGILSLCLCL